MARYGFLFRIRPELKGQFKKAHDEIWPQLVAAIKEVGMRNYTHFYREDGVIFAAFEADDPKASLARLAEKEVRTEWEKTMERFFIKSDHSYLGPETTVLEEIFHLD
jgi:L-rhamnose mutarotase